MSRLQPFAIGVFVLGAFAAAAAAQPAALMVSGSTSSPSARGIVLFDPHDGSPLTGSYYFEVLESTAVLKHAMQVGEEIWFSAQVGTTGNQVLRYDLQGNFLGGITEAAPGQPLNNIRGMALVDGIVYLTNSGSSNGAPGPSVVTYEMDGTWRTTYSTTGVMSSPFSAIHYNGELIVADSGSADLHRYGINGVHLGPFHVSSFVSFVQQLFVRSNGNLLACGWSSNGLHEFDAAGNLINTIPANSPRGVYELGNGNIMWSGGSGVHVYDVATQTTTTVLSGFNGQYIDLLSFEDPAPPCPADLTGSGSVGVGDLLVLLAAWGPCPPPPVPSGQCVDSCGGTPPSGQCHCDEGCFDFGDCCPDVCDGCWGLSFCGAPPANQCPADLNDDDTVGVGDLLMLLANWGPCPE